MLPTITVMHADHVAALCTHDRVYLERAIEQMPPRHPDRIHVAARCLVAGAILRGDAPGPYDDQEAEAAAILLAAPDGPRRRGRLQRPLRADRTGAYRARMARPAFTATNVARAYVAIAAVLAVAYLLTDAAALVPVGAGLTVMALVVIVPDAIRAARDRRDGA
jgi:hypothetical protein